MATKKAAKRRKGKKLAKAKKMGDVKPLISLTYQKIEY
jgi:hypothetical protein